MSILIEPRQFVASAIRKNLQRSTVVLFFGTLFVGIPIAQAGETDALETSLKGDRPLQVSHSAPQLAAMAELNQSFSQAVIIPAYVELTEQTESLLQASQTFEAEPTETHLIALRKAWLKAASSWAETGAFAFGPIHSLGYSAALDSPCDAASIEAWIQVSLENANGGDTTLLRPAMQGFEAIAYVLKGDDGEKSLADFSRGERQYLSQLAVMANDTAHNILDVWQTGWNGYSPYAAVLETAGEPGNGFYLSEEAATEEIVRTVVNHLDVMVGEVLPELLETSQEQAEPGAVDLQMLRSRLQGIQAAYGGRYPAAQSKAAGIAQLVAIANPRAHRQVQQSLTMAMAGVNQAIANPSNPEALAMSLEALTTVHELLDTEVLAQIQPQE